MTPSKDIQRLIEIMAALRTPVTGCPWDLEQTFATIAPYTIEEAYEVADAIERGALGELKDELGDLLLQVVYHSRMAEEQGAFAFVDVVEAVTGKMIRRHPHVFGDEDARKAGVEKGFWERIKSTEKRPSENGAKPTSILSDVPTTLPALTRAIKLQSKAAKVGFDWPNLAPVFAKLKEEIAEFEEVAFRDAPANTTSQSGGQHAQAVTQDAIKEEFGDMLFVMANIARHLEIDPEACLRSANAKFSRRFAYIEQRLSESGLSPAQSNLEDMDALWNEVRAADKNRDRR
jgi:nucleoside triphosphate diphosphatase